MSAETKATENHAETLRRFSHRPASLYWPITPKWIAAMEAGARAIEERDNLIGQNASILKSYNFLHAKKVALEFELNELKAQNAEMVEFLDEALRNVDRITIGGTEGIPDVLVWHKGAKAAIAHAKGETP